MLFLDIGFCVCFPRCYLDIEAKESELQYNVMVQYSLIGKIRSAIFLALFLKYIVCFLSIGVVCVLNNLGSILVT